MENSLQRMKELVEKLDQAAKAYYQEDREIMSNQEYDSLYDQLEQLEKETGTVLTNSPTVRVGYEAVNELPKEEHPSPMLSLDKTKDREVLRGPASVLYGSNAMGGVINIVTRKMQEDKPEEDK